MTKLYLHGKVCREIFTSRRRETRRRASFPNERRHWREREWELVQIRTVASPRLIFKSIRFRETKAVQTKSRSNDSNLTQIDLISLKLSFLAFITITRTMSQKSSACFTCPSFTISILYPIF